MIRGPDDETDITQELRQHQDLQTLHARASLRLSVASAMLKGQLIDLNPPRTQCLSLPDAESDPTRIETCPWSTG